LMVLALVRLRRERSPGSVSGEVSEMAPAILLIITAATPGTLAAEVIPNNPPGVWRGHQSDGPNSLYVFLRVLKQEVSLEAARGAVNHAQGDVSLVTLRDAARQLGLPTRIVKCGPSELASLRLPAIVRLTDSRCQAGKFVLLYHCGEKSLGIMDG